jgi:hypothetical protein
VEVDSTVIPEHKVVLLDPWWETEYMGVAVGALVTVILILIAVIIFIMYKNHVSNNYPAPDHCYQSQPAASKSCPPGTIWEDKSFPASPRKLPPTPMENHYRDRDTSMEYSSPLLNTSLRQQHEYAASNWGRVFSSPLPRTLPTGRGSPVVSHYAATDLIGGRERLERNPGAHYL